MHQKSQPTRHPPLDRQTNRQNRHQGLIRHRIDDRPHHRLQLEAPGNPSVDEIGDAGIGEEAHGPGVLVVQDEIADDGGGEEAGEGEEVGDGVDVFVRGEGEDAVG